jgi:hypothetical protein
MPYTRPYAGGFVDYPSTTTPIDSTALNTMDVGIQTSNDQFQTVTTAQRTALSPTVGQAVWDSDLRQLMVFMNAAGGNAWQPVGNTIVCESTTRPSVPFEGQRIYETDSNRWFTYSGAAFVPDDLVFTNEAARDAAITAPVEGMSVYLTSPTVPAATGATTAVPTGIKTIYNGSVWVCTTEVGASSDTTGTTTSTSYVTTLTGDGTAISATLVTGTTVMISITHTGNVNTNTQTFVGFAVSGASTIAASDYNGVMHGLNGINITTGTTYVFTGLTAGTNTFTMSYKTQAGTQTSIRRRLVVKGIA